MRKIIVLLITLGLFSQASVAELGQTMFFCEGFQGEGPKETSVLVLVRRNFPSGETELLVSEDGKLNRKFSGVAEANLTPMRIGFEIKTSEVRLVSDLYEYGIHPVHYSEKATLFIKSQRRDAELVVNLNCRRGVL